MFYEEHRPGIEEIIANLEMVKNDFWTHIDSYHRKYNFIQHTFSHPFYQQQAINWGAISPYANSSTEMMEIAFSINSFMNNIYQALENAIYLWFNKKGYKLKQKKNKFHEGMKRFFKTNGDLFQNPAEVKPIILEFRYGRNFFTHYGRVITIDYIFVNSGMVFDTICNVLAVLREQIAFNEEGYQSFLDNRDEL